MKKKMAHGRAARTQAERWELEQKNQMEMPEIVITVTEARTSIYQPPFRRGEATRRGF